MFSPAPRLAVFPLIVLLMQLIGLTTADVNAAACAVVSGRSDNTIEGCIVTDGMLLWRPRAAAHVVIRELTPPPACAWLAVITLSYRITEAIHGRHTATPAAAARGVRINQKLRSASPGCFPDRCLPHGSRPCCLYTFVVAQRGHGGLDIHAATIGSSALGQTQSFDDRRNIAADGQHTSPNRCASRVEGLLNRIEKPVRPFISPPESDALIHIQGLRRPATTAHAGVDPGCQRRISSPALAASSHAACGCA